MGLAQLFRTLVSQKRVRITSVWVFFSLERVFLSSSFLVISCIGWLVRLDYLMGSYNWSTVSNLYFVWNWWIISSIGWQKKGTSIRGRSVFCGFWEWYSINFWILCHGWQPSSSCYFLFGSWQHVIFGVRVVKFAGMVLLRSDASCIGFF